MAERDHENIDFEDELRRYWRKEPFIPFEIVTTSGDRYQINDPGQIAFGSNTIIVALRKTGIQLVRKNQIVAVHIHEPTV
jgi:hypothetical protein